YTPAYPGLEGLDIQVYPNPVLSELYLHVNVDNGSTLRVEVPQHATEGEGVVQGTVRVLSPVIADLSVELVSDDTAEVIVEADTTILAGASSATFEITVVDDGELDSTQIATIAASAEGYFAMADEIAVFDDETATLTIDLPVAATEGDGVLIGQGTVSVDQAPTSDVVVELDSNDTTEIVVSTKVILPAGQTSATFDLTVVDDGELDDVQNVTVTAHVANWTDGLGTIGVFDNENYDLFVAVPADVWEDAGLLAEAAVIGISGTLPDDLLVSLSSIGATALEVPPTVTIPAGETSVAFDLVLGGDDQETGSRISTVAAVADGFDGGSDSVRIKDDDVHGFAFDTVES
ncbi:hypothetical protein LCGC14_3088730, partial [marine sediment metagenome]